MGQEIKYNSKVLKTLKKKNKYTPMTKWRKGNSMKMNSNPILSTSS